MSNPPTNFLTGGVDLSSIFMPLSQGSAYSSNTGYTVNNNDLNTIFAKYVSGTKANPTGYTVNNIDLSDIFAKYITSQVGIQWTQRSFPNAGYVNVLATAGSYWIVGSSYNIYYTSNGGENWNTSSYNPVNGNYYGIAGNSDGSLFCMSNSGNFYTSANGGASWTFRQSVPNSAVGNAMVYSNGVFVNVYLYNSASLGAYSSDGISWTNSSGYNPGPDTASWWALATDGNNKLVTTGYKDSLAVAGVAITAYSSDNGQTWTEGDAIPNGRGNTYPIAYGNGIWVAISNNAPNQTVVSSSWPPSWTVHVQSIYGDDITFCSPQGKFYVSYGNSGIYSSSDGINWTEVLNSSDAPFALGYNEYEDKFIGVSFNKAFCFTSI
jgi:hypothetical protein|uniref:Exo-alpha-sialidase n=1 Tax=viral metagenome TaxID=1070528 RepID=A0A6C0CXE7_9ZZZZ